MVIVFFSVGTIFSGTKAAFSQEIQPTQEDVQFIPMVPTEKSNVTASIRVFSLDVYCKYYTIDKTIYGHDIVINIKTRVNPAVRCQMPMESDIFLRQGIGQLGFGVYDAKLLINGTQKASTKLYVSQGDVEITATGKYTDQQGDLHIVGDVKNTALYPVKLVQLDVSFVNGDQVIADKKLYTTMEVLLPQTSSGFDLLIDSKNREDVNYFVRTGSFLKDTGQIHQGLKITAMSFWQSSSGVGTVGGSILNMASVNASQVKVVCVLYDYTGTNVLDSIFDYTSPSSIISGQTGRFVLSSHYPITSQFTPHCNAESAEVAILTPETIPEFSMPVLVFVTTFTVLIVFNKFISITNNP